VRAHRLCGYKGCQCNEHYTMARSWHYTRCQHHHLSQPMGRASYALVLLPVPFRPSTGACSSVRHC
jgi:hypothetical protein